MRKEAKIHNKEKTASSINDIEKTGQLYVKTGPLFHTIYKNKVKMYLNGWHENLQTPRRKHSNYLFDIHLSYNFFYMYLHRQGNLKAKKSTTETVLN